MRAMIVAVALLPGTVARTDCEQERQAVVSAVQASSTCVGVDCRTKEKRTALMAAVDKARADYDECLKSPKANDHDAARGADRAETEPGFLRRTTSAAVCSAQIQLKELRRAITEARAAGTIRGRIRAEDLEANIPRYERAQKRMKSDARAKGIPVSACSGEIANFATCVIHPDADGCADLDGGIISEAQSIYQPAVDPAQ